MRPRIYHLMRPFPVSSHRRDQNYGGVGKRFALPIRQFTTSNIALEECLEEGVQVYACAFNYGTVPARCIMMSFSAPRRQHSSRGQPKWLGLATGHHARGVRFGSCLARRVTDKKGNLVAFTAHDAAVFDVRWTLDDERIFTTSADEECRVWDAEYCKLLYRMRGHHCSVRCARYSPFDWRNTQLCPSS